jgi:hypothetical protein
MGDIHTDSVVADDWKGSEETGKENKEKNKSPD